MNAHPQTAAAPATPAAAPACYAGIDVGGTNIKIGLVDDQGATVASRSLRTEQQRGARDAAARAATALRELVAEAGVKAVRRVGLATPGPMDAPAGLLICPGNLPAWHNTPVRDLFAEATGLGVTYANDANAAAWGEFWRGAGAQHDSLVLITLGTGVGGGIVIDDRLVDGRHSCGGEIGHIVIDASEDAPVNSLGLRGTLEGCCGSYGVVRQAERLLADGSRASPLRDAGQLTPKLIAQAAAAGDALALAVVDNTARVLAAGVATCVHVIDPDSVAIGGGLNFGGAGSPLGERFINRVRVEALSRLIPSLRDKVEIGFAHLGGAAGFIGAAGLAMRDDSPAP